ncbi:aspartyl-tRNA synthetase, partial [Trifolium pratense]
MSGEETSTPAPIPTSSNSDLSNVQYNYDNMTSTSSASNHDSSNIKVAIFSGDALRFEWWKDSIYHYVNGIDDELWDLIEEGVPIDGIGSDDKITIAQKRALSAENKKIFSKHNKVKQITMSAISHDEYTKIMDRSTAKAINLKSHEMVLNVDAVKKKERSVALTSTKKSSKAVKAKTLEVEEDSSSDDQEEEEDEELAMFTRNFQKWARMSKSRKGNSSRSTPSREEKNCFKCNKPGHFIAECPEASSKDKSKNDDEEENVALMATTDEDSEGSDSDESDSDESEQVLLNYSKEQLLTYLGEGIGYSYGKTYGKQNPYISLNNIPDNLYSTFVPEKNKGKTMIVYDSEGISGVCKTGSEATSEAIFQNLKESNSGPECSESETIKSKTLNTLGLRSSSN